MSNRYPNMGKPLTVKEAELRVADLFAELTRDMNRHEYRAFVERVYERVRELRADAEDESA